MCSCKCRSKCSSECSGRQSHGAARERPKQGARGGPGAAKGAPSGRGHIGAAPAGSLAELGARASAAYNLCRAPLAVVSSGAQMAANGRARSPEENSQFCFGQVGQVAGPKRYLDSAPICRLSGCCGVARFQSTSAPVCASVCRKRGRK